MSGISRSPRPSPSDIKKVGGDYNSQGSLNFPTGSKKRTSLDIHNTKLAVSSQKSWCRKQKRAYHRILSGMKKASVLGKKLRFITLTSSTFASSRDLNRDFEILKKRIRRHYGLFEYFKVRTNEGNGVLHVLYRGSYIPQFWLSRTWRAIHHSHIVDIRMLRMKRKRLARYLVSQYIAGQSFIRNSWSWGWVFKGFVGVWKHHVRRCENIYSFSRILKMWEKIICQHALVQKTIFDYR